LPCCSASTGTTGDTTYAFVTVLDGVEAQLLPDTFGRWFASRGWAPRAHQLELLAKAREDRSVLLIAPTGGGKTLAGFLPTLVELSQPASSPGPLPRLRAVARRSGPEGRVGEGARGLHTL
jgi:ATP-dependent helicase Lhr and Lhr-like helicase